MLTRITKAVAVSGAAALLAVAAMTGAAAHDEVEDDGVIDSGKQTHAHDQHGGVGGHLDAVGPTNGLRLLSRTALKNVEPGKIADVGVLGSTAYVAAWGGETCKHNGVHVVDISNLRAPREIAFIHSKEGSYPGEGVQALSVSTRSFTGDLLVTNNETCNATAGFGGMNIYDVSVPSRPTPLYEGYGDDSHGSTGATNMAANEIHSVFAWDAGDRAYAVMVDNEEALDVDIVDISNPKRPQLVAEYDLAQLSGGAILQPGQDLDEVFLHDMVVKKIGSTFVMLASYWDAGYVQLDVTDPRKASILQDSDFTLPDPEAAANGLDVAPEGNAHQAEFTADNRYVLAADEDFAPLALRTLNVDDGTSITANQGSDTRKLQEGETITGASVFVGRACNGDTAVPVVGDGTQIAVVERGVCTFTEKVTNVLGKGYEAVLIFNRTASDGCENALSMSVKGDIPTFGVAPRSQGYAIFDAPYDEAACKAGDGTQLAPMPVGAEGDTLTFSAYFDGWGYVHLYDGSSMAELDTYAIPEAHDPAFADGFGDLSVHEVATSAKDASLAYLSYYSGGLRVVGIEQVKVKGKTRPQIVEKAVHIDEGGSNFWGVETFTAGGKEYIAASDRDLGLYLYEYTPVNAAP